jgi:5-methylcytosine-specific restriction protein A
MAQRDSPPPPAASPKNPDWRKEEVILGLDLYMRHRASLPSKTSREIKELSSLLLLFHAALGTRGKATLRNTNGVYMKLMNFRRLDPTFELRGRVGLQGGGHLEEEAWQDFSEDQVRLAETAQAIARGIHAASPGAWSQMANEPDESIENNEEAAEGGMLTKLHKSRERNQRLVTRKKDAALKKHGKLACEVCAFDYRARYGERGAAFIECHHNQPLASLPGGRKTKLSDLSLLCANCHRMIHAKRKWLSLADLRVIVTEAIEAGFQAA